MRFYETIIIFKRIELILKKEKEIQDAISKLPENENKNLKMSELMNEYFRLGSEISVDIQSLYAWVYMIKDIFIQCKVNINLEELERISYVRNMFIVHITKSSLFKLTKRIRSGMMHNPMVNQ